MNHSPSHLSWTHEQGFQLSTDPGQISLTDLNDFFSNMAWAKPLPETAPQSLVHQSLCFALYEIRDSGRKLIGISRWISDFVIMVSLTDVYILPAYHSYGLGKWMMGCVDQTFRSIEHFRPMILIVNRGSGEESLYRKHVGMEDLASPTILLDRKGRSWISNMIN